MNLVAQLSVVLLLTLIVFFFACGLRHIFAKLNQPGLALGAVFALGSLTLLHIATILTSLGVGGVWAGECLFLIFMTLGIKPGWKILVALPQQWRTADGSNKLIWATGLYYLIFWLILLRDNISLSSYHDGIAHLSWFIDVHRSGYAFLSKLPLSFSEPFGLSPRSFYPTGMQALIAMMVGHLMRIGVTPTLVLKSCQIFAHLCLIVTLLWGVRKHWPKVPNYLLFITALVSTAAFRFPMDASAEGGLARLVAFAVVFPLSICLGTQRIFGLKGLSIVSAIGLLPAFLLHPSVFWLLALSLGHAVFFTLREDVNSESLRGKKIWENSGLWLLVLSGLFAATEIILLMKITGSHTEPAAIDQMVRVTHSIIGKLSQVFQIGLSAMYAPQSAFRLLFHLGLIGALILWRRNLITSRVASFHLTLFTFALLALVSEVLPIPGAAYIGGAFYYHPARAACIVYIGVWIVALSAFPLLDSWIKYGARRIGVKRDLTRFIIGLFLLWALQFHIMILIKLPVILDRWDKEFNTPHWSSHGELIDTLNYKTAADSIIIARPFDVDILGPATRRDSLFIYGDYISGRSENEKNKLLWFESVVTSLKQKLFLPLNSDNSCEVAMSGNKLAAFSRPLTLILSERDIDLKILENLTEGSGICSNIKFLGIKNNHGVFQVEGL